MKSVKAMSNGKTRAMAPEALELVAARFRVLAEPVRLRILQVLGSGELSVNAIAATVQSTQPNVSKHLRILEDAGLISRRQEGNTVYCSIQDQSVFDLCDAVCSSLSKRLEAQARTMRGTRTRV